MDRMSGVPARRGTCTVGGLTLLLSVLLIVILVVVNQSSVHWRDDVVDSHYFAYCGWCVFDGARPYLDVWDNKPPGTWWVNALGCWLCGKGLLRETVICSAALAGTLIAFMATAWLSYGRGLLIPAVMAGGILLTDMRFDGGANRTEPFVVHCETLAVLFYLLWLRRGRLLWLVAAGTMAGAAPLFKQSGLAAAGACAVHLLWIQLRQRYGKPVETKPPTIWRPWLAAGGGFVVAPLISAVVLTTQGALSEAWYAIGPFNQTYFAARDATWLRLGRALQTYWPFLRPIGGIFVIAGIGLLWGLSTCWRGRQAEQKKLVSATFVELYWLWFLFAVYLACVGPGRRGHHFLPALAPLGLLCLYPLYLLARRDNLGVGLTRRASAAFGLIVWIYLLGGAWMGNVHEVVRIWRTKPHWYSFSQVETKGYQLQAMEIQRLCPPEERIYVWGWSPGTYRYAYRRCVSRFATLEKLGQVGAGAEFILAGAKGDIRRSPPKVFVISSCDLKWMMIEPRDEFARWLDDHYENLGTIDGMCLMKQ